MRARNFMFCSNVLECYVACIHIYYIYLLCHHESKINLYNYQHNVDLLFGEIFNLLIWKTCSGQRRYLALHDLMLVSRQTANNAVLNFLTRAN